MLHSLKKKEINLVQTPLQTNKGWKDFKLNRHPINKGRKHYNLRKSYSNF